MGKSFVTRMGCIALLSLALWPVTTAQADEPLPGFTAPFRQVTVTAVQPGRIATLGAQEGQAVAAGHVLVQLDDAVQRSQVAIAEAQAESLLAIRLAEVRQEHADRELKRVKTLEAQSAVSAKEVSDAEAAAAETTLLLEQTKFEHGQALRELALQQARLEEYAVAAPLAGVVVEQLKEVGDTVEENEPVVTVVQLDPLVVTLACPLVDARALERGDHFYVAFGDSAAEQRVGTVAYVSPVADAASQTVKVKLHVPNADGRWWAGMRVRVDLTSTPTAADIKRNERELRCEASAATPTTLTSAKTR